MSAARWKTISWPAHSAAICWASRTSPRTIRAAFMTSRGKSSSQPQESNELYWASAVTCAPARTSASVRCEPMKPSAPVTRAFFPIQSIGFRYGGAGGWARLAGAMLPHSG